MNEYTTVKSDGSYIEWSTIIAGAVLASALSLVMLQFGSALGIADMETFRDDRLIMDITPGRLILAGLYILIIQVLSSMLGGYIAGRMRAPFSSASEHEKEVRDGIHGVLVWATATLAVAASVAVAAAFAHLAVETPVEAVVAQDILERERHIAILLAFAAGSTSLVSGVAAWVAGVAGGDHRDRGVDYSKHVTFIVRR